MTLKHRLILTVCAACAMLMSACAGFSRPSAPVQPPRRAMPDLATASCTLPRIPAEATNADLEKTYAERGLAILACDAARRLAVETHAAEHADQDRWLAETRRRALPPWRRPR